MYNVVALIGESGCGKDTIMQRILAKYPMYFNKITNCTTRPIRENEINGVNYFFMNDEEFIKKIEKNEMLEHACFNNWYYGTSLDALLSNCFNIGVFNPTSIRTMVSNPEVDLTVYRIECDGKTRLLRQLNRELHPNVDEIVRRYCTDKIDFNDLNFPYISVENIDNEDLDLAVYAIVSDLGLVEA